MEDCPDCPTKRIRSKRRCWPMTNSFVPSALGVGLVNNNGPTVSCVGRFPPFRKNDVLSRNAQISCELLRADSKRKYRPSDVHLPAASCGGLFQSDRSGWRS